MQNPPEITAAPLISKASERSVPELMAISAGTFVETYASVNTADNMRNYIADHFSEPAIRHQLSTPGTSFYLLRSGNTVAGYLKLNSGQAQTEQKEANTLEIERIYVAQAFKGKGFGRLLVDRAVEIARRQPCDYLWLGVWEHNRDALAFYRHLGFVEFGRHVFMLGNDEQQDLMMKLEI